VGYLNDWHDGGGERRPELDRKNVQARCKLILQTGMGVIIFAQAKVPASPPRLRRTAEIPGDREGRRALDVIMQFIQLPLLRVPAS
jgi:hypothetical protein